jgi:HlyD family secretion protein
LRLNSEPLHGDALLRVNRTLHPLKAAPMSRRTFVLKGLFVAKIVFTAGVLVAATWPAERTEPTFQGWVEANLVFIGADEIGRVETLAVREGDAVKAGAPLFTLDADLQKAAVQQDEATLANAQQTFKRAQELLKSGSGTKKEFDSAQSTLSETQAKLSSVRTRLTRRNVFAPAVGTIHQVYFRPGEVVPVGRPVVSLLPPSNIKIRFYVAEALLPQIKIGAPITVTCDGCAPHLRAEISFISQKGEYTPPVIYSLEERAKLVFLVEARPDEPELVRVGQPVHVRLAEREAPR